MNRNDNIEINKLGDEMAVINGSKSYICKIRAIHKIICAAYKLGYDRRGSDMER